MTETLDRTICAKVTAAIADTTFLRCDEIDPTSRFIEDLAMDELDTMEAVLHVEDMFQMRFSAETMLGFHSIPDVVRCLSGRLSADSAALASN